MKIGHVSDLHYCPEHFDEVDRCFGYAVECIVNERCDAAVISGDLFDHRVDLHDPCVYALLKRVHALADCMPVLILQGTFSHDAPGSLNVFKTMGAKFPVHVADYVGQVLLVSDADNYMFICSDDAIFRADSIEVSYQFFGNSFNSAVHAIFSVLPPVNKGQIAALGHDNAAAAAGEYVFDLMRGWSVVNDQANNLGIPTVIVSHGTVNGSTTEQGVPMHGNDHEFTTGALFASRARAIMLGHIHQAQTWRNDTDISQAIAYPGSPGRLHFGELSEKGFLIWNITPEKVEPVFYETPAKRLLQVDIDGEPDLDALRVIAEGADGAHVRIRYTVAEENSKSIDKAAISAMFGNASECKIEGRIKPITRTRAEGISKTITLEEKLQIWAESAGQPVDELKKRLADIQALDPETIIDAVMEALNEKEAAA